MKLLPRLAVYYPFCYLQNGVWKPRVVWVEVLTLHINNNTMRVRTLDPIPIDEDDLKDKGTVRVFDMAADEFFEKFIILERETFSP